MSEEKNIQTSSKPAKKKKNIFKRMGGGIARWFREMRSELKKVVWPTRKQVVNNTIIALVVMVAVAIVIWGFDQLASQGVQALISIGR